MDKTISLQDIFDAAWQKFIVEDAPPAVSAQGCCSYLTEDGRKCAVGLCIPDGHKAQTIKDIGFSGLVHPFPELWADDVMGLTFTALDIFQNSLHDAHTNYTGDWTSSKENREQAYRKVAQDYGLTIPGEQ